MRTSPSPTSDAITIVVFTKPFNSLHIVQTLVSPAPHSSPMLLHISICEQKLKYWASKRKIQPFDYPIYNHLRYTMLYPLCCENYTSLQLPTLHTACTFMLYRDGVFSYLQCSWIVKERFEPGISEYRSLPTPTISDNLFSLSWKIAVRGLLLFSQRTLQL